MKVLIVIASERFLDMGYTVPKKLLEDAGHQIITASTKKATCYGMHGEIVCPDLTLDEVNPADYDGIIISGGIGCQDELWRNEKLTDIANYIGSNKKFAAAICLAPVILAEAGLLKGKKVTALDTPATRRLLALDEVTLVTDNVVTDGNIITAKGPFDAENFTKAILALL